MIPSIALSFSRALYVALFFHSFNTSAACSPLFLWHSSNILFCQYLNISELKCTFFSAILLSAITKILSMGFKKGGREAV
jgi:hypothetical protein